MVYDYSDLIGRTIVAVGNLSQEELDSLEWEYGIVITLDDGTTLTVSKDDDNYYPGSLSHWDKNNALISVYS